MVDSLAILFHSGHLSSAYTGIFIFNRSRISQLVTLHFDSKPFSVLCHMGDFGSGDGGWTPVLKIDGSFARLVELVLTFGTSIAL